MRKSREEAARTRERIVSVASEEFRKNGIADTGLADVMKAAELTHGGFYRHFASKDALVAEAMQVAIDSLVRGVMAGEEAPASYLSQRHRDHPASGCPFAALGSELVRADLKTRESATEGFRDYLGALTQYYQRKGLADSHQRACVAASTLIGALTMARMVTDEDLSRELLAQALASLTAD